MGRYSISDRFPRKLKIMKFTFSSQILKILNSSKFHITFLNINDPTNDTSLMD